MKTDGGKVLKFSSHIKIISLFASLSLLFTGCSFQKKIVNNKGNESTICVNQVKAMRKNSTKNLVEKYKDLQMIDSHNHDVDQFEKTISLYDQYYIDKVAITGYVSRESSILTDELSWKAYSEKPDRFFPLFSGINLFDQSGIEMAKKNLEKGFMGIGEIAAQSLNSPILSSAEWKGEHPLDGNLPEIYELAAKYKAPVLLHIDPPSGLGLEKLEEALYKYPNTTFIFGHINVANTPKNVDKLMSKHPNLFADIYAGYTENNPRDPYTLKDYVKVIEKYSNRIMLGTDSGVEIEYTDAIKAMYKMIDLLKPATICKVSHENFLKLMNRQAATQTQIKEIKKLSDENGIPYEKPKNKHEANKLIFKLTKDKNKITKSYENIPNIKIASLKPLESLNEEEMVAIGRDLLTRVNFGYLSKDAKVKAKDDWEYYYNSVYFPNALSESKQDNYKAYPDLNRFEYLKPSFENESVQKEPDDFIYNVEMNERLKKDSEETPYLTLYRVWIGFDKQSKTYKIQKILGVDIKR